MSPFFVCSRIEVINFLTWLGIVEKLIAPDDIFIRIPYQHHYGKTVWIFNALKVSFICRYGDGDHNSPSYLAGFFQKVSILSSCHRIVGR
ncbi:hypothetical protein DFT93_19920 [Salmonella enterica subsp. enterica serovar Wandsworth]|uniref:Uncharacterized protein n=1 Tax=Salmonella enterica subsp. enterica serovar Wandsworth TaxID=913085 RepID=A0A5V9GN56_SALET|nr:hypothetical protein [Salmonella enterica subsp. enterica serovar Wandsworth]EBI6656244.1 hypothetical protein [Salmonella enterica]EBH8437751.1 hypothetical protein [Salmonella enterica subsp. enterica serovar Wandsworth]EBJ5907896.1 hypothetical protein [Salmonella enterica]EBN6191713.1 hypothetical protein [Salmonella enterica]